MSTTRTTSTGAPAVPRTVIQLGVAAIITAPAALHALRGEGSPWSVVLVFVLALSAIWILSALAMSVSAWFEPTTADGRSMPPAAAPDARPTTTSQPLARIAVAQVPAEHALHADEHGNVTAATNMGDMR